MTEPEPSSGEVRVRVALARVTLHERATIKNLPVPSGTRARQKLDADLASEVGTSALPFVGVRGAPTRDAQESTEHAI
jgi:hypothetical protein